MFLQNLSRKQRYKLFLIARRTVLINSCKTEDGRGFFCQLKNALQKSVHSLIMNLNEISKPHSFLNFSYILYFQNRDLSRWSLTSETLLLSLLCWGIDACKFVEKEGVRVPWLTLPCSQSIFWVICAEEPSPCLSSASEVSLNLK